MKRAYLTKAVVTLSWISLLSDVASEMLYPIMPVYLKTIGFTALVIGILEGLAAFVVGISNAWFGNYSDRLGSRIRFIRVGYFLSAVSKSMMALFTWAPWIFLSRSTDRLGKGIRTGARDAMLADESHESHRGKVFGFHRGMDSIGAAIGPCCALLYLYFYPGNYRTLFLIAFLPGMAGVALTFLLKEKHVPAAETNLKKPFGFFSYWRDARTDFRKVTGGLLAFALFNSSDAFILLIAKHNGLSDVMIIGAYVFYNLVYAIIAFPAGIIADKLGPKRMFVIGLLFFIATYALMPYANTIALLATAFFLYGIYAACTEGISKAWISMLCKKGERATALGFYSGSVCIVALLSSTAAGLLWIKFSPAFMFYVSASGALLIVLYFLSIKNENHL